jgi:hypothetical protein
MATAIAYRRDTKEIPRTRFDGLTDAHQAIYMRLLRGSNSVVECNLAKVDVESSNLFSRSAEHQKI